MKNRHMCCLKVGNAKKRRPNPLKQDPTRTALLRRMFTAQIKERFARLRRKIIELLVDEDALGLMLDENPHPLDLHPTIQTLGSYRNSTVRNAPRARWQFKTTPEKVRQFKEWLKTQLKEDITGMNERQLWEAYTREGLKKGAGRAFDDTKGPAKIVAEETTKQDMGGWYQGTKDEFLRSSFNKPVAIEKVQLLAGRAFDELDNVTGDMATRMTRTLTDGLVQGRSPRDIARDMDRDIEIGRNRALTIARTEVIRAHAEGQLMALEEMGVEEVGVAVEWSTTGDDKVCELCQPLEGVVLKLEEAKGMLPRHPNCRCAWIPANVGEAPDNQKSTRSSITGALSESVEREGGDERSRWTGADRSVSASRPESQVAVYGNVSQALLEFSSSLKEMGGVKG